MAESNPERLVRLLGLLAYLDRVSEASLDELAARFDVPVEQIRADIDLLWVSGRPGGQHQDLIDFDAFAIDDGIVRLEQGQGLPQTFRLTDRESIALAACLQALRAASERDPHAEAVTALIDDALEHLSDDELNIADVVDFAWQDSVNPAVIETLQQALREHRRVRIDYIDAGDRQLQRVIEPLQVRHLEGRRYLDSWCLTAQDLRRFRLDRIQRIQVLADPVTHTVSDFDLPDGNALVLGLPMASVRLRLRNSGRVIPETIPYTWLEEHDDDSFTVELQITNLDWLRRLILENADHIISITPSEVAEAAATQATAALTQYSL